MEWTTGREGEEGGEGGKEGGGKKETKKTERKGRRGKEEREKKEEAEGEDGGWVVLSDRDLTPRRLDTYTILSVSTPSTSLAFLDETTMMTYRSLHK
jgi:hypothetical protein